MTGVHYVAAELSYRGFVVAVTSRNAPAVDILATNKEKKTFGIQVKTNHEDSTQSFWLLSARARTDISDNLFYVFVNLKGMGKRPDFYIVRSEDVSRGMAIDTRSTGSTWYSYPRKKEDQEKWDLLK